MQPTDGVYFRREDYAGFWLRLLIDVIDVFAVSIVCTALAIPLFTAFGSTRIVVDLLLTISAVIAFCYFVLLKRSKFGTIGYRVGGVRIGLDGQRPRLFALTLRLLFAVLGPLMWIVDLIWLAGDMHRQALRDKFAQTYIVKRKAEPAGTGRVVYRYYDILGYNLMFREIQAPKITTADA